MDLATLIRVKRAEKRLSQQEVARMAGVSRSFVSMVESGKTRVRVQSLRKLARALDISAAELSAVLMTMEDPNA
ncbi:hypothetical protein ABH20_18370 [Geobacillus sp. T6]|uniref:helix-turn-helix domain-containing protein n=1 Tax=Bacteria TaxID=2 RepID=UPI00064AF05C|nr:hypothetical protein ABH20_18370 [Geobacillus sp. T6]